MRPVPMARAHQEWGAGAARISREIGESESQKSEAAHLRWLLISRIRIQLLADAYPKLMTNLAPPLEDASTFIPARWRAAISATIASPSPLPSPS